jgi:hypothetical protein
MTCFVSAPAAVAGPGAIPAAGTDAGCGIGAAGLAVAGLAIGGRVGPALAGIATTSRPPRPVILVQAGAAIASGMPDRSAAAVLVTPVMPVPAGHVPATGTLRGALWVLGPPVPGGQNDDNEDNHDNYCQADHKLSHRTIQSGMASQCGASEAHAAIDAGLTQ